MSLISGRTSAYAPATPLPCLVDGLFRPECSIGEVVCWVVGEPSGSETMMAP